MEDREKMDETVNEWKRVDEKGRDFLVKIIKKKIQIKVEHIENEWKKNKIKGSKFFRKRYERHINK